MSRWSFKCSALAAVHPSSAWISKLLKLRKPLDHSLVRAFKGDGVFTLCFCWHWFLEAQIGLAGLVCCPEMHPSSTASSPFTFLIFSLRSGEVNRCFSAFPSSSPTPPRWSELTSPVQESPGATSFATLQTPCHLTCHTSWQQGKQQHTTRQPQPRANGGEEEGVAEESRCTTSCSPKAIFFIRRCEINPAPPSPSIGTIAVANGYRPTTSALLFLWDVKHAALSSHPFCHLPTWTWRVDVRSNNLTGSHLLPPSFFFFLFVEREGRGGRKQYYIHSDLNHKEIHLELGSFSFPVRT